MKKLILTALTVLLCAALTACSLTAREAAPQPTEEIPELLPSAGVTEDTFTVFRGDTWTPAVHDAWVTPYTEEMSPDISARIAALYVSPGQDVSAGDPLVRLDLKSIHEQLEDLREDLSYTRRMNAINEEMAELQLALKQSEYRQMQAGGADAAALRLKSLEAEQAQLDLNHLKQNNAFDLEDMEKREADLVRQLTHEVLYAGMDGRISWITDLAVGDWVSAYQPLVSISDPSRLFVSTEYIADYTWNSATGGAVAHIDGLEFTVERIVPDSREYVSASLKGEKYWCSFLLTGPEELLPLVEAGQYCALELRNAMQRDQLLIPVNALQSDGASRYVYLMNEDGQKTRRNVSVRLTGGIYSVVLSGLEEGDVICVTDR